MASKFFGEIESKHQSRIAERARELRNRYGDLAKLLDRAKDKELADDERIEVLRDAQKIEASCIHGIEGLLNML